MFNSPAGFVCATGKATAHATPSTATARVVFIRASRMSRQMLPRFAWPVAETEVDSGNLKADVADRTVDVRGFGRRRLSKERGNAPTRIFDERRRRADGRRHQASVRLAGDEQPRPDGRHRHGRPRWPRVRL